MSGHTPGPWEVDDCYWRGSVPIDCPEWRSENKSVRAPDGNSICMVQGDSGKPMDANARLIAAAPEMLEAIKAMVENLESIQLPAGLAMTDMNDAYKMAKLAIAKAEGKS